MKTAAPFFLLRFGIGLFFYIGPNLPCAAQESSMPVYYHDQLMRITNRENAVFYTTLEPDTGKLFKARTYNLLTSQLVIVMNFLDSGLVSKHGPYIYFNKEGRITAAGQYYYNLKDGLCREWNNAGGITDSVLYETGVAQWQYSTFYHPDQTVQKKTLVNNITKVYEEAVYDIRGNIVSRSRYEGDEGATETYRDGYLFQRTVAKAGKKEKTVLYNADGSEMDRREQRKWKKILEKEEQKQLKEYDASLPEYPGGDAAFYRHLEKNIRRPAGWMAKTTDDIRFTIFLNKEGKITDVKLWTATDGELVESIIQILKAMPAFDMKGHSGFQFTRRLVIRY
jgi:hypothetical protein